MYLDSLRFVFRFPFSCLPAFLLSLFSCLSFVCFLFLRLGLIPPLSLSYISACSTVSCLSFFCFFFIPRFSFLCFLSFFSPTDDPPAIHQYLSLNYTALILTSLVFALYMSLQILSPYHTLAFPFCVVRLSSLSSSSFPLSLDICQNDPSICTSLALKRCCLHDVAVLPTIVNKAETDIIHVPSPNLASVRASKTLSRRHQATAPFVCLWHWKTS